MGLIFLIEQKMRGKRAKWPFSIYGGAISETNQPWHEYQPPAAPNTTKRYPDASNR
jgi:hypothetical protein